MRDNFAECNIHAARSCAGHQLDLTACCLFADIDSIGNAHEIGIFEFDARSLISVIKEDVEASRIKLGGQGLARFTQRRICNICHGDHHREGSNGCGQPETIRVV